MTSGYSVTAMNESDVVPDLIHIISESTADVDGITAAARRHPAYDPEVGVDGEDAMLVTFTDAAGRSRVAELAITVVWREQGCWHLRVRDGDSGEECAECGLPLDLEARCPECQVPVTDSVTLMGVHTASCVVVMCQCEHLDHETGAAGHPYLGVVAGSGLRQLRGHHPSGRLSARRADERVGRMNIGEASQTNTLIAHVVDGNHPSDVPDDVVLAVADLAGRVHQALGAGFRLPAVWVMRRVEIEAGRRRSRSGRRSQEEG